MPGAVVAVLPLLDGHRDVQVATRQSLLLQSREVDEFLVASCGLRVSSTVFTGVFVAQGTGPLAALRAALQLLSRAQGDPLVFLARNGVRYDARLVESLERAAAALDNPCFVTGGGYRQDGAPVLASRLPRQTRVPIAHFSSVSGVLAPLSTWMSVLRMCSAEAVTHSYRSMDSVLNEAARAASVRLLCVSLRE